jgi:membrane-associated protein
MELATFIQTVGYIGLFVVIFSESGFFLGAFLPGDSLLFTAGFLASQSYFNIWVLLFLTFTAAVLGDSFGYTFGRYVGPRIFTREDSFFFHKEHLARTERFFRKHGGATIILARFLPFVRTFAPILAGVGKMHYPLFLAYNVAGGFLWGIGITSLGYVLGSIIPNPDRYLLPLVLLIIVLTTIPPLLQVFKEREHRERAKEFLRKRLRRQR